MTEGRQTTLLRQRQWDDCYRPDYERSILAEFYVPALTCARRYDRAVGYFTSGVLAYAARGMTSLVETESTIRLVCSPALSEEDERVIREAHESQVQSVLEEQILAQWSEINKSESNCGLRCLAWLIENNRLEVKLAFPVSESGRARRGIFHDKLGLIYDANDDFLAFKGSANETESGLISNFESIDVYPSWNSESTRARNNAEYFEQLWADKKPLVRVLPFSSIARDILQRFRPDRPPRREEEQDVILPPRRRQPPANETHLAIPGHIDLRDYQKAAIRNWIRANGQGVISLATGTGKTITALALAAQLNQKERIHSVLVVCPYRNLVEQWANEVEEFNGRRIIKAFESRKGWQSELHSQLLSPPDPTKAPLIAVTTLTTLAGPAFQKYLPLFRSHKPLLVVDEAHHAGAAAVFEKLPSTHDFKYRLALSATPIRHQDEEGTDRLLDYFGGVLKPEVTVRDAIEMERLTPYEYFPHFINLDEEEEEVLQDNARQIGALISQGHSFQNSPRLAALLSSRSRLIAGARSKLDLLRTIVRDQGGLRKTLIYCGAGKSPIHDDDDGDQRTIEAVLAMLGHELGVRAKIYTAETKGSEREAILRDLASGDLHAVVAINCLDEGVDVPSIKQAIILASSQNPRQIIQRRGRILRRDPGKSRAVIHDAVVVPRNRGGLTPTERTLLGREIRRYQEFAQDSINYGDTALKLISLLEELDIILTEE